MLRKLEQHIHYGRSQPQHEPGIDGSAGQNRSHQLDHGWSLRHRELQPCAAGHHGARNRQLRNKRPQEVTYFESDQPERDSKAGVSNERTVANRVGHRYADHPPVDSDDEGGNQDYTGEQPHLNIQSVRPLAVKIWPIVV